MNSKQRNQIAGAALLLVVLIAACTKQPSSQQSLEPAGPKPFQGEVYRTLDDSEAITLVSVDELELRRNGENLICKYTKQDGTFRVVANIMGTPLALYYKTTDQGLGANDGTIFFSPTHWTFEHDVQTKDYDQAVAHAVAALHSNPKDPHLQNSFAWLLATCPRDSIRNGKEALKHAIIACELTEHKNVNYVDTLAAAYAEAGDFDQAVIWQNKCLEFSSLIPTFAEEMRQRAAAYNSKQPFRDVPQ